MSKGLKSMIDASKGDLEHTKTAMTEKKEITNGSEKDYSMDWMMESIVESHNQMQEQVKENLSKNRGGRPTNVEKGIKSRKQYTLTLKEDTYKFIMDKAKEEDLSFAKFMEKAALEYIENHK